MSRVFLAVLILFLSVFVSAAGKKILKIPEKTMTSAERAQKALKSISFVMQDLAASSSENTVSMYILSHITANSEYPSRYGTDQLHGIVLFEQQKSPTESASMLQELSGHPGFENSFMLEQEIKNHPVFSKYQIAREQKVDLLSVYFLKNPQKTLAALMPQLRSFPKSTNNFPINTDEQSKLKAQQMAQITNPKNTLRTFMDPKIKAYSSALVAAVKSYLPSQKVELADIIYEESTPEDAVFCEKLFYDEIFLFLQKSIDNSTDNKNLDNIGKAKLYDPQQIIQWNQIYAWKTVARDFSNYFRQVIGFQYAGRKFTYIKFRAHLDSKSKVGLPVVPDNTLEYNVMDGGSAYFEFFCDKTAKKIFSAHIHGES